MQLVKNWRWMAVILTALVIVGANVLVAPKKLPFQIKGDAHSIDLLMQEANSVFGVNYFLSKNFSDPRVANFGDTMANEYCANPSRKDTFCLDVNFSEFLGMHKFDDSLPPIDVRNTALATAIQSLNQGNQYRIQCNVGSKRFCTLKLVWSPSNLGKSASFVGYRVTDSTFALVDTSLLTALEGK